jgi:hypothetical protein
MSVDAATVDWLKRGHMLVSSTDSAFATAWGTEATETEIISALALAADATTEAGRQQPFLEGPLVIDLHDVPGLRTDLLGRVVTLTAAQLSYDSGVVCFVIGVEEKQGPERTLLTVLRRLT